MRHNSTSCLPRSAPRLVSPLQPSHVMSLPFFKSMYPIWSTHRWWRSSHGIVRLDLPTCFAISFKSHYCWVAPQATDVVGNMSWTILISTPRQLRRACSNWRAQYFSTSARSRPELTLPYAALSHGTSPVGRQNNMGSVRTSTSSRLDKWPSGLSAVQSSYRKHTGTRLVNKP